MRKISLEDKLYEQAKKYAEEEGFPSVTAFLRHLIASYPFIKELKRLCELGLLVPTTQAQIHKTQQLPERQLHPTFCGNSHSLEIADKLAPIIFDIFMNPDKYVDKVLSEFYEDEEFTLVDFRCMAVKKRVKRPMVIDMDMKVSKLARSLILESHPEKIPQNSLKRVIKTEMRSLKVIVEDDTKG